MRNDIDVDKINIDKILDEINESRLFLPEEEIKYNLKAMQLADKIIASILSKVKGKKGAYFLFDKLLVLIDDLGLSPLEANFVFTGLDTKLSIEKQEAEGEAKDDYKSIQRELNLIAVSYVTRCIERELKNFDLPKKLTLIKHNLKNSIVPDDLFSRQAFENLKKEFEEKIEQEKIEVQNRQILGDSLDDSDKKENAKLRTSLRLYDLRHSHATLLLKAGVHAKVVSERLGHSTIALTLDVYSHVLPSMQAEAAAHLETMLYRKNGTK